MCSLYLQHCCSFIVVVARFMARSRQCTGQWKIEINASELFVAAKTTNDDIYGTDHVYGAQLKDDVCQKFASVAARQPMEYVGGMIYAEIDSEDEHLESSYRMVGTRTYRSCELSKKGIPLSDAEEYEVEAAINVAGRLQATGQLQHMKKTCPAKEDDDDDDYPCPYDHPGPCLPKKRRAKQDGCARSSKTSSRKTKSKK